MAAIDDGCKTKLGSFIRKRRKDRGLTLAAVGKTAGVIGSNIGRIERGDIGVPSKPVIRGIARALGVSASRLMNLLPAGANPKDQRSHAPIKKC